MAFYQTGQVLVGGLVKSVQPRCVLRQVLHQQGRAEKRACFFFLKLKKYNNNSKTDYIEAHKQEDRNDAFKLDSASLLQLEIQGYRQLSNSSREDSNLRDSTEENPEDDTATAQIFL